MEVCADLIACGRQRETHNFANVAVVVDYEQVLGAHGVTWTGFSVHRAS
jgi:hypothetical protein